MRNTAALPEDYMLHLFRQAVRFGLEIEGHLLSQGEVHRVTQFLDLEDGPAHVYARLHSRQRHPIRLDSFHVPGEVDLQGCLTTLQKRGFTQDIQLLPPRVVRHVLKASELKRACSHHGLPVSGRRADLMARLTGLSIPDIPPCVQVRHTRLFRRLLRAAFQDHDGDITKAILNEMGLQSLPTYTRTNGSGRFKARRDMRQYEDSLDDLEARNVGPNTVAICLDLMDKLAQAGRPDNFRYRFSAQRFWGKSLKLALRQLERTHPSEHVKPLYAKAMTIDADNTETYRHRLALLEERSGHLEPAFQLYRMDAITRVSDYALVRSGRRLAKKFKKAAEHPWPQQPVATQILNVAWEQDKPLWRPPGQDAFQRVESATIGWLRTKGRVALHAEGGLWTTLCGLLYQSAFFAPIPEMLPCDHLTSPLDLGTPEFIQRRETWIASIHEAIRDGRTSALLENSWRERHGQRIAGLSWTRWSLSEIQDVASSVHPDALIEIMALFLTRWRDVRSGLPDLFVLPGPPVDHEGLHLTNKAIWIEIKGPGDSLRDAQRWWIERFKTLNVPAEVWRIQPAKHQRPKGGTGATT